MKIYIASDHRGYQLKNNIVAWLKQKGYDIIDCGPEKYDPLDDYVDYANDVVTKLQRELQVTSFLPRGKAGKFQENSFGILICGSGIGMSIAANRHKGIRAGLGFNIDQVKHGRQNDNINVLILDSDYLDEETNEKLVEVFLNTPAKTDDKY